jgi:hypothetical protein
MGISFGSFLIILRFFFLLFDMFTQKKREKRFELMTSAS